MTHLKICSTTHWSRGPSFGSQQTILACLQLCSFLTGKCPQEISCGTLPHPTRRESPKAGNKIMHLSRGLFNTWQPNCWITARTRSLCESLMCAGGLLSNKQHSKTSECKRAWDSRVVNTPAHDSHRVTFEMKYTSKKLCLPSQITHLARSVFRMSHSRMGPVDSDYFWGTTWHFMKTYSHLKSWWQTRPVL